MTPEEVRRLLEETGALLHGHFVLSSGLHSGKYFQCAKVLSWPSRAALLGSAIGGLWQEDAIDVVVGPALGGILIAHEVARSLGVRCLFTERVDGKMALRRGFAVESGERALVVEDVVTTGGSAREVVELLEASRASVAGVTAIVWRSPRAASEATLGAKAEPPLGSVPFRALWEIPVDARASADCPQCREGKPFEKPGSRTLAAGARKV